MGYDTTGCLIRGYKMTLQEVFDKKWIDPVVMKGDDWQYFNMGDLDITDDIILPALRTLLETGTWKLYFLTSTQEDYDFSKSYLFIYDHRQELDCEGEYSTGLVIEDIQEKDVLGLDDYAFHWIVEHSW